MYYRTIIIYHFPCPKGYQQEERPRRCREKDNMMKTMRKKIYKKAKMIADMMKAYDGGYGDEEHGGYGYGFGEK